MDADKKKLIFNTGQLEAINFVSGNLLIIASAGTGKTTTIVERYANMVNNHGYKPSEILMTTFTNKAAQDMTRKIVERTGSEPQYIGTMHSLFLRILRQHAQRISLNPGFTLIHEESERYKMIRQLLAAEKIDTQADTIKYFGRWISKFKNLGVLAEDLSEDYRPDENASGGITEELQDDEIVRVDASLRNTVNKIYKKYEQELRKRNSIDLDDILLLTFKLLDTNPDIRDMYTKKFRAIMVDEAQDLNVVQKKILNLLKNKNLCIIGDDCQNIYEWRGSSNGLVFDFSENEHTVFLKDNYRSSKNIIDAVNKTIQSMKFKIDKKLQATKSTKGNVAIESFANFYEELEFIVYEVKDLLKNGVPNDQIAVLFRTNRIGKEVERELKRNGISCHLSKSKDFLEREEVKDVISFLRLKINHASLIDFQRVFLLLDGLGKGTAEKFEELAAKKNCSLIESLNYFDGLRLKPEKLSGIMKLKSCVNDFTKNPIALFLGEFGYRNILLQKYDEDHDKIDDKMANIRVLTDLFAGHGNDKESIMQFLDSLIEMGKRDKTKDTVTLSTIHSAKGLEWEHVFLISCNERTLPFYTKELTDIKRDSELRLFYVAISRTKSSLVISHYESGEWGRAVERSHFLDIIG